jgi:tetratricopeptide (TPR) repeat protein
MIYAQYGNYMLGRYPEALEQVHRALDLDSASALSWSNFGVVENVLHKPDSALIAYRRWNALGNNYGSASFLVLGNALAGHWAAADALRDSLVKNSGDNSPNLSRMLIDFAYAKFDDAMTAIETGLERREPVFSTFTISCDPLFDYLKPNPRFGKLMARYGIKPCPARNVWPVPKPPR